MTRYGTLLGTEPRTRARVSFAFPAPSQGTDGDRPGGLTQPQRRVSSVSSSVPPRVDRGVLRGFLFAAVFFVPFWLLVVYAAVRGVW